MSVGLHCRLARPGRVAGLAEFLDYAKSFRDVWICTREEIADFWYEHHYPVGAGQLVRTTSTDGVGADEATAKDNAEQAPKSGELVDIKL